MRSVTRIDADILSTSHDYDSVVAWPQPLSCETLRKCLLGALIAASDWR
jgi:hypothetical protein